MRDGERDEGWRGMRDGEERLKHETTQTGSRHSTKLS